MKNNKEIKLKESKWLEPILYVFVIGLIVTLGLILNNLG